MGRMDERTGQTTPKYNDSGHSWKEQIHIPSKSYHFNTKNLTSSVRAKNTNRYNWWNTSAGENVTQTEQLVQQTTGAR